MAGLIARMRKSLKGLAEMIEPDHSLLHGMLIALGVLIVLSLVSTLLYLRRMEQRTDTKLYQLLAQLGTPTDSLQPHQPPQPRLPTPPAKSESTP